MTVLVWLIVGIAAGAFARRMLPRLEGSNYALGTVVAIIGAAFGSFAAAVIGVDVNAFMPNLLIACLGSLVVLFFYRLYLTDVINE